MATPPRHKHKDKRALREQGVRSTPRRMDPKSHARFLDYRERHSYFARGDAPMLTAAEFTSIDSEFLLLEELGEEKRTDEEEQRFAELLTILFRD